MKFFSKLFGKGGSPDEGDGPAADEPTSPDDAAFTPAEVLELPEQEHLAAGAAKSDDLEEPQRSLTLGREHLANGQHRDAIPHYQRYLRSNMDAEVFDELAEVYAAAGETYLASSAQQIARSIRAKGV